MRKVILFQGDSLTDSGRNRKPQYKNVGLGSGYVTMLAGKLCAENPDIEVVNHAYSGSRAADMYGRWQEDTLNINYDLLSILCGINDIGFGLRLNMGSDVKRFEYIYDRMLWEATEKNPNGKIVLGQPFLFKKNLEGTVFAEEFNNDIYNNWETWNAELKKRQEIVLKLSEKYKTMYAPFADELERATESTSVENLTVDCIHTTVASDWILAQVWLKATKEYFENKI